jgi:hypothetical protein
LTGWRGEQQRLRQRAALSNRPENQASSSDSPGDPGRARTEWDGGAPPARDVDGPGAKIAGGYVTALARR